MTWSTKAASPANYDENFKLIPPHNLFLVHPIAIVCCNILKAICQYPYNWERSAVPDSVILFCYFLVAHQYKAQALDGPRRAP